MRVVLRATISALFLFAVPLVVHADSWLVWGWELDESERITMIEGGTYAVPLNVSREAVVESDASVFLTEGVLFRIPNPDENTRDFVAHLGGLFGDELLAWTQPGVYELDVYDVDGPFPTQAPWPKRIFAFLFGTTAHAQSPELFIETIRFTIVDAASATAPDPVIIIPGILGSEKHNNEWVIDPILHSYDDLIATLDANGYTPEFDLFTFPYNWRESNVDTALLLKKKIDDVKEICDCDKVDLVAHSMGGLVARQYIQSDAYEQEQDVDQLIFLGTPHLGAPSTYLMWEAGEVGPFGLRADYFRASMMESILSLEAHEQGYDDVFSYVRGGPIASVQQLLPIYNYLSSDGILREYPNNYPINEFLEELNENPSRLLSSGVQVYNLTGEIGPTTISEIDIVDSLSHLPKWEHGYPKLFDAPLGNHGLILNSGDGTVPTISASDVNSNLLVLPFDHRGLVTGSEANVFNILTGQDASILVTDRSGLLQNLLLFKILSPADLLVEDPHGNKIGKENGQEINNIPNAFYTGFNTDTEFITILNPSDGNYKIYTEGTGSGAYTVETNYISEQGTVEASFTGNTTPGLVTELTVPVSNANPEELEIQPADTEPPIITITQPQAKNYLRSEQMSVDVSAQDASGVFALQTLFGTTTIPNTGTVELFFKKLGNHVFTASSTDNVGNSAIATVALRIIATVDSTLADIERAYSLGWMTKKIRDDFVKKFNAAVKISKVVEKKTNGKPKGQKIQKVVDKILAAALIFELNKLRGKGLINEQAYQLLKEDIQWLINN